MSAAEPLWLAIDQGGHASRAIVYDTHGQPVAEGVAPITTHRPHEDRVEHDGEEIVRSVHAALDAVAGTLGPDARRLRAAGLATQRSSVIAWHRERGTPLGSVLSWQDRRAASWLATHGETDPPIAAVTGLVRSPHYGASKLRWLLENDPAVRAAAADGTLLFGPLASFLLFRLVRERPTRVDPANASRTLLCDWRTGTYAPALLAHFGLDPATLPSCGPSRDAFGHLDHPTLGGVPVTVMTGDQSAALFADGTPDPADASVNIGTGAFVQRVTPAPPPPTPGLLRSIVWRDDDGARFALEGTVNGAGAAIEVVAAERGIDAAAAWRDAPAGPAVDPPLFLNGVGGLGSPYWRSNFPSRFIGGGDGPARLAGVLESIVFLIAVNVRAIEDALGPCGTLLVTGGGAAAPGLTQRLASLTGRRVECPAQREATSRGLAFLLAGTTGWPASPRVTVDPTPDPALAGRFTRWQAAMAESLDRP